MRRGVCSRPCHHALARNTSIHQRHKKVLPNLIGSRSCRTRGWMAVQGGARRARQVLGEYRNLHCVSREQFLQLYSRVEPKIARQNKPANGRNGQKETMLDLFCLLKKEKKKGVSLPGKSFFESTLIKKFVKSANRKKPSTFSLADFISKTNLTIIIFF